MLTESTTSPSGEPTPILYPRMGNRFTRFIGRSIYRLMGWRLTGDLPNVPKAIIIGGPHTSNWDLALAMGAMLDKGLKFSWMMKREAFVWPLGPLWRALGGIAIDRSDAKDIPQQMADWFDSVDAGFLGITPEGTRKAVTEYRRGYLRIAHAAGVPVFVVGIDAARKTVVLDRLWPLSADIDADNAAIRDFVRATYNGIRPAGD